MSIRELKAELDRLGVDYSDCREKSELVEKLAVAQGSTTASASDAEASSAAPAAAQEDVDVEASLAQMNNLLDTLPSSITLLSKKWSDAVRCCGARTLTMVDHVFFHCAGLLTRGTSRVPRALRSVARRRAGSSRLSRRCLTRRPLRAATRTGSRSSRSTTAWRASSRGCATYQGI